jgi:hypothetical protein
VSSVEALSTIKSSVRPVICGRTLRTAFSKKAARLRVQMATVMSGLDAWEFVLGLSAAAPVFGIFE